MIALAGDSGSVEAVDPLVSILTRWDPFGRRRGIRLRALRALGDLAHPTALPRLSRFFRDWRVPIVAMEERRAAFESLKTYPDSVRTHLVHKGLRFSDPRIRETCRRLAEPS